MILGCCNPWDSKVLRSASGAHFFIHFLSNIAWKNIESHIPLTSYVYLADSCKGENSINGDLNSINFHESDSGNNISSGSIDENNGMPFSLQEDDSISKLYEVDEDGNKVNISYDDEDHLALYSDAKFPLRDYTNFSYYKSFSSAQTPPVLILGGETGLSDSALKFAAEMNGVQLCIPMHHGIDSLNNSVASGVIVYEMRKQYQDSIQPNVDFQSISQN